MPIEERKATLAKLLRRADDGIAVNEHYSGDGAIIAAAGPTGGGRVKLFERCPAIYSRAGAHLQPLARICRLLCCGFLG